MKKTYLLGLAAVTVVAAVIAGWWLSQPADKVIIKSTSCDLNQSPCQASTSTGATIQLNFTPKPVPLLQPITIEADLTGFANLPEKIQVVVEGINMYMGFQKVWLEPQASSTHYKGTLQIPTCEMTDMGWKVSLLFPIHNVIDRAEFYMKTHKL
jgi:hypothetical protein